LHSRDYAEGVHGVERAKSAETRKPPRAKRVSSSQIHQSGCHHEPAFQPSKSMIGRRPFVIGLALIQLRQQSSGGMAFMYVRRCQNFGNRVLDVAGMDGPNGLLELERKEIEFQLRPRHGQVAGTHSSAIVDMRIWMRYPLQKRKLSARVKVFVGWQVEVILVYLISSHRT
jgi:hypothetical protein